MGDYEVMVNDDLKIVHVTARGDLSKSLGHEIITNARTLAAEKGYGILYDVRNAESKVGLADWFHLPRELEVLKEAPTREVRVALVVPPAEFDEYKFYETVATNVGLILKAFLDLDEAIDWVS